MRCTQRHRQKKQLFKWERQRGKCIECICFSSWRLNKQCISSAVPANGFSEENIDIYFNGMVLMFTIHSINYKMSENKRPYLAVTQLFFFACICNATLLCENSMTTNRPNQMQISFHFLYAESTNIFLWPSETKNDQRSCSFGSIFRNLEASNSKIALQNVQWFYFGMIHLQINIATHFIDFPNN